MQNDFSPGDLADSKYIFVVGIGGSDLASKAVWNAVSLHKGLNKKVFFLEAPDHREYSEIEDLLKNIESQREFTLVAISKSGETKETLETFEKMREILSQKFSDGLADRVIVISTKGSSLWKIGEENKFQTVAWEGNIGGRFSAFTIAHTAVLKIAGVDAGSFVRGGDDMRKLCLDSAAERNPAYLLAKEIFDVYKSGVNIWDFFIFNSELEDLGKWSRQLIAESLSLVTPTVSLGPTDLHSMLELYLGGPKNRFTLFVISAKEIAGEVNAQAFENVTSAYKEAALPFEKFELPEINEYEIGQYMEYLIEVVIELGKLLEINIFDQPAVEQYKNSIHNQ